MAIDSQRDLLVIAVLAVFAAVEVFSRSHATYRATPDDTKLEVLTLLSLTVIIQPAILAFTTALGASFFPEQRGALSHWPGWAMFAVLLVVDDLTQYAWHRASHSRLLWPLHRAHHSAHAMSVRITYRNNFFYYALMPGIWLSGIAIYLGFADVYALYVVIKLTVIMGAHCAVPWDRPLYRVPALRPLMWLVERTVSTPATHWAHHAMSNADGIGHYRGNFGNLLFVWDILFGTAHLTRRYPPRVGLRDDELFGKERWYVEMFYPLLRSRRAHSALVPGATAYDEEVVPPDASAHEAGQAAKR